MDVDIEDSFLFFSSPEMCLKILSNQCLDILFGFSYFLCSYNGKRVSFQLLLQLWSLKFFHMRFPFVLEMILESCKIDPQTYFLVIVFFKGNSSCKDVEFRRVVFMTIFLNNRFSLAVYLHKVLVLNRLRR